MVFKLHHRGVLALGAASLSQIPELNEAIVVSRGDDDVVLNVDEGVDGRGVSMGESALQAAIGDDSDRAIGGASVETLAIRRKDDLKV